MLRLLWFQLGLQNVRERGDQRESEWSPCVRLDLEENIRCSENGNHMDRSLETKISKEQERG